MTNGGLGWEWGGGEGLGSDREWGWSFFLGNEDVLTLFMKTVTQFYKCTQKYGLVHFKWEN